MQPKPGEETLEEALDEAVAYAGEAPSVDELVGAQDVTGLIELGAAHRAGVGGLERDLFKALECFEAASRLGSAEAEYLVGVSWFNGLGIGEDRAEGAKRLRSAAQRGSLRAKVYVANLYEMGVHYARDRDKADVWYRNVARASEIADAPESDAFELAMAELGCVRHCLTLVGDSALPKADRTFYLKKAKAMGYAHALRAAKQESIAAAEAAAAEAMAEAEAAQAEAQTEAQTQAEEPSAQSAEEPEAKPDEAEKEEAEDSGPQLGAQWTFGRGALAAVVSTFFAAAASGVGFLASEGSRALVAAGRVIPEPADRPDVVLLATIVLLGVVPATAVYRARVVAIGGVLGAAAGAGAYFLHASQPLLWSPVAQAGAGGLAVFLLTAWVLGLLGGTRH